MAQEQSPIHHEVHIAPPLLKDFKEALSTPVESDKIVELKGIYGDYLHEYRRELTTIPSEILTATGEYPLDTPYDKVTGPTHELPGDIHTDALVEKHLIVGILNHPARIKSRERLQERGYQPPPPKNIPVIDHLLSQRIAVTFSDFGYRPQPPLQGVESSAQTILATGLNTWMTDTIVTSIPYATSSMPDINSALSLKTIAVCGGMGFIPVDSIWNQLENQILMARRTFELLEREPALQHLTNASQIIEHARKLIGATLKSNPEDAVKRAEALVAEGVNTFRVYDPRSMYRLEDSVDALRQRFGSDITIIAGQVVDTEQAHRIVLKGANAIVAGIGEGGICTTPREAAVVPPNVAIGYEIMKTGLTVPLIFDGGVGQHTAVAVGIGGGAVIKSQALVGGTIEQPPGLYWYLYDKDFVKKYSGEAAKRTKFAGGKIRFDGKPIFVEGVDQYTVFNPEAPTMATNIFSLLESFATTLVFQRASTIAELQHQAEPDLWTQTVNAAYTGQAHHNGHR